MTLTPEERAAEIYIEIGLGWGDTSADEAMIAAEIRAAIAEATRWIPVSERLPEYGENVIVLLSDVNQVRMADVHRWRMAGIYTPDGWGVWGISQRDFATLNTSIVAWQPMPPLPTEEQT